MSEAGGSLRPAGRILVFFGTSGDVDHLKGLIDSNGFTRETVASRDLTREGQTVTYWTFCLRAER